MDNYLSTYYSGQSFILVYLYERYFWSLIIIIVWCNWDLEKNEHFTFLCGPYSKLNVLTSKYFIANKNPPPTSIIYTFSKKKKTSIIYIKTWQIIFLAHNVAHGFLLPIFCWVFSFKSLVLGSLPIAGVYLASFFLL